MRIANDSNMHILSKYLSRPFERLEKDILDYLFKKNFITPRSDYWAEPLKDIMKAKGVSPSSQFVLLFGRAPDDVVKAFSEINIYSFASGPGTTMGSQVIYSTAIPSGGAGDGGAAGDGGGISAIERANWNLAYEQRRQWSGVDTGLDSGLGRSSLNVLEYGVGNTQIRNNQELDARYVEIAGDTMTGSLKIEDDFWLTGFGRFDASIGSSPFISGFAGSGWRYDEPTERLTVDNLTVRRQLKVYELLIEQIRANRGSLVISPGDAKVDSADLINSRIYVDTDDGRLPISVVANDLLRCQRWTGEGVKYYIIKVDTVYSDYFTYTVFDGIDDPAEGDELVVMGNTTDVTRQGLLYLTSSDDGAPYIDVLDGVDSASFAEKHKVRLGKLTGISDASFGGALSGYGLYSNNVYLKGKMVVESGSDISGVEAIWPSDVGLEMYLPLDEGIGSLAFDNSGNDITGTLSNNAGWIDEGIAGGMVSLLRASESRITHAEISFADNTPYTYSTWIKWDGAAPTGLVIPFGQLTATSRSIYLGNASGASYFNYRTTTDNTIVSTANMPNLYDGDAHHLAWTVDSARRVEVWVDGVMVGGATLGATSAFIYSGIGKGHSTNGYSWNGWIDEPRIYSRKLSGSEIRGLYKHISSVNANRATRTTIEGGLVTTGRIILEDGLGNERAGMTGAGTGTDIAIWAGGTYAGRASASFRADYDGEVTLDSSTLSDRLVISSRDKRIAFQFKPTGYDDWFLPSKDELEKMHDNLHAHSVGGFLDVYYWSSSENNATYAWSHNFFLDLQVSTLKTFASARVRPVRKFTTTDSYSLRDTGPADGLIFHIVDEGGGNYTYYEAWVEDLGVAPHWSNVDDVLIGTTGTAIGTGTGNTADIISQTGHTDSPASWCDFLGAYENRIVFTSDEIPALSYLMERGISQTGIGRDGFYSFWDGDNYVCINPNDSWYNQMIQSRGGVHMESSNQNHTIRISDSFISLIGKSLLLSKPLGASDYVQLYFDGDQMGLSAYGTGKITIYGLPEGISGTAIRQIYKKWDGSDMVLCIND